MHNNTIRLHELMAEHKLCAKQVAKILNKSYGTVKAWRVRETSRVIPDNNLRLLELLLKKN